MTTTRTNFYDGIGTDVSAATTSEEALALGGLNWEVASEPTTVVLHKGEETAQEVTIPFTFTTYRKDTNTVFGFVGDKYNIIQNSQALAVMDDISEAVKAGLISIGSIADGKKVFLISKIPGEMNIVGTNDRIEKYLRLTASHDGKSSLVVGFTPIHTTGRTMFGFSRRGMIDHVAVRHTSSKERRLQEAIRILKAADNYFETLESTFKSLAEVPFTSEMFDAVLNDVLPIAEDAKRVTRTENSRGKVREFFNYSPIITGTPELKDTALAALYAFAEYADHGKVFSAHKDKSSAGQNRFLSVTEGTAYNFKNAAFNSIVDMTGK